jgi:hypothetical protein
MAITSAICTSFKQELLVGTHNFTATTGNTFKIALFTSSATLGAGTTAFADTNEITNSSYNRQHNSSCRFYRRKFYFSVFYSKRCFNL